MPIDASPGLKFKVEADTHEIEDQLASLSKLSARFSTTLSQAFVDTTLKGKGLGDTLRTLTVSLSELTLKSVFQPLTSQIGAGMTGMLGNAANLFNPVAFAKGGALPSMTMPFADGGVIASPVAFPLTGNRTGLAGEAGPEAILPLARGPDGSLGVRSAGGGAVSVTFNVTTPDAESFRRSETQLSAMLARAVAQGQRTL